MDLLHIAIALAYLVAGILFILGLRQLSSPATARLGNRVATIGMLIALAATLSSPAVLNIVKTHQTLNIGLIALGIAIGGIAGAVTAYKVKMTAMPQMVALYNGVGGGAAAVVSAAEFLHAAATGEHLPLVNALSIMFGTIIGSISFTGSLIAFGKLQEILPGRPLLFPGQNAVNGLVFLGILGLAASQVAGPHNQTLFLVLGGCALLIGVLGVIPIGGADMPVVISLLNSCTGLAAAATGFQLHNNILIISGTLVGASGALLTHLMSKAMNRSIGNVLFSGFGTDGKAGVVAGPAGVVIKEISADDASTLMAYSRSVIIVPGYGMAVAQAQHSVRELGDLLEAKGVEVRYAIHPVAGRMPGHMNVLLAEADVPYDKLLEMDQINDDFERTDVALVIGANDVTNPAARSNPQSPIYGMPILNVDHAKNIIIMKRSMKPGFAGIDNELYYDPKCRMLFGDAKASAQKLVTALKEE
ncbi:MAG: NAD(P)(+) transhydrogenase (Re/Si-specific) subunit beta [Armatimonadetes bacterium]|nr:NAD(P)(+) transhydrogenase (Re/Si-specific) subunit beta [Armatimonadota bacterium]